MGYPQSSKMYGQLQFNQMYVQPQFNHMVEGSQQYQIQLQQEQQQFPYQAYVQPQAYQMQGHFLQNPMNVQSQTYQMNGQLQPYQNYLQQQPKQFQYPEVSYAEKLPKVPSITEELSSSLDPEYSAELDIMLSLLHEGKSREELETIFYGFSKKFLVLPFLWKYRYQ